jgi:hypothetical protein
MKRLGVLLALSLSVLFYFLAPQASFASSIQNTIADSWGGVASVGAQVAVSISGSGAQLKLSFLNSPSEHPDAMLASLFLFAYFARPLSAMHSAKLIR